MLQSPDTQKQAPNQNSYVPVKTVGAPLEQATIGRTLVIKGEISGSESLFVDGKVEGTINLPDHRVTIGRNGHVAANVSAKEVVIYNDDTVGGLLQAYPLEAIQEFTSSPAIQGRGRPEQRRGHEHRHEERHQQHRRKCIRPLPRQVDERITQTEKAALASKADYRRYQFGGTFGGPIVKDRRSISSPPSAHSRTPTGRRDAGTVPGS